MVNKVIQFYMHITGLWPSTADNLTVSVVYLYNTDLTYRPTPRLTPVILYHAHAQNFVLRNAS